MSASKKKRVWSVGDFAEHVGINHRQAKRLLQRLDREMKGRLLLPSEGANRQYKFVRAVLARARPEYFEDVESAEERIEELEEKVSEALRMLRMLGFQTGANSAAIAQLQQGVRRGPRAA